MDNLVCVKDFEEAAKKRIPQEVYDFFRSGAGQQYTLGLNRSSLDKIRIRPRYLRDVSNRDMKVKLFGEEFSMPLGIGATAAQKMAHYNGEIENARAAGVAKVPFIIATLATTSIEDIRAGAPDTTLWLQLYIFKNRNHTESLIRRAEKCKVKAILITADSPVFGYRLSDRRASFKIPSNLRVANILDDDQSNELIDGGVEVQEYCNQNVDASLTWEDIRWVQKLTSIPILVKGIVTKEDALIAADMGLSGILVSNHGARHLDGIPAPVEALPEIVEAVGHRMVILADGGVHHGNDILKLLALGAKMVFIGRPALWGLAVNGQQGVEQLLSILREEFDIAMAISGCKNLQSITRELVVSKNYYKL